MAELKLVTSSKALLRNTFVEDLVRRGRGRKAIEEWVRRGRPAPPPHAVKVQTVLQYARRFDVPTLVETGTFRGDMIAAVRRAFQRIYSIELNPELATAARARFKRLPHISIIQGDSGIELGNLLPKLDTPCLFWLDGHWVPNSANITSKGSVETPILDELRAIFKHPVKGHVILIDDARTFDGTGDYPTLAELTSFITQNWTGSKVEVDADIVRVHRP